jgi:molecular chaperone GrpE
LKKSLKAGKIKMKKHEQKHTEDGLKNLENQLKRALADYQNLEKRIESEKSDWIKLANKDFILKILPTLDHLETALKGVKDTGKNSPWLSGIELAVGEFRKILKEEGLEQVQTESFDPNLHEAVEVREGPDGKILDIIQMGYTLNGKLIRPAKVVVGKGN